MINTSNIIITHCSDLAVEKAQNEVMDAGVSERNINIDQRTEVAPSELINEIPNGYCFTIWN